jgi:hypothetical protein
LIRLWRIAPWVHLRDIDKLVKLPAAFQRAARPRQHSRDRLHTQ